MFDSLPGGGLNSVINVRTWSTHTVELGDVLARMNNMLRCARRFLVGAAIYGILESPTFAVCLWVVHLEPHLLDNTGPLTRDTAVRRGGCPSPEVYPVVCRFGMRHRGLGSVYFIVQRSDVRFLRSHRSDQYPRDSPAFTSLLRLSRLSVSLFDIRLSVKVRESLS